VDKQHTNSKGGLHGTLSANLVDWLAGLVIATYGSSYTGVSTDIHVSYLASATEGEILEITGKSLKKGATLAFVSVEITKPKKGEEGNVMVVTGLHNEVCLAEYKTLETFSNRSHDSLHDSHTMIHTYKMANFSVIRIRLISANGLCGTDN
jgi:Thioesterase superfamily